MKTLLISMIILLMSGCARGDQVLPVARLEQGREQASSAIDYENRSIARLENDEMIERYDTLKETMIEAFGDTSPHSWGENVDGVITEIDTDEKIVALTFDACDGSPDSYDEELINYLIDEEVPATLFIGGQWIKENEEAFMKLSNNPLFEIANHGYDHQPLSVTGEVAYHIQGTADVGAAFDEVFKNQMLINELTGETPKYFRSGTAHYDDVAVAIVEALGLKAVNYNVLGDAGGTFNQEQINSAFETAKEGSIFLFHMNQPDSEIASGVKDGIRRLKDNGFNFVQLQEYDELLK